MAEIVPNGRHGGWTVQKIGAGLGIVAVLGSVFAAWATANERISTLSEQFGAMQSRSQTVTDQVNSIHRTLERLDERSAAQSVRIEQQQRLLEDIDRRLRRGGNGPGVP